MEPISNFMIRAAVQEDLEVAADVLAEAFNKYSWTRWSIPDEGYSDRLRELHRLYLQYAFTEGLVLVEDSLNGVIALLPPHAAPPSGEVLELVAGLHGERFAALAGVELPPPPQECWTLETVGVRPQYQGLGLGGALVRTGLDAVAARSGLAVALETSDKRNVRLYSRAGFAVVTTTKIDQGPMVYSMVCHNGGDEMRREFSV